VPAPATLHGERPHAVLAHVGEIHRLNRIGEAGFCHGYRLLLARLATPLQPQQGKANQRKQDVTPEDDAGVAGREIVGRDHLVDVAACRAQHEDTGADDRRETEVEAAKCGDYEASTWYGVGAPINTSARIIGKLNRQINAALADSKMKTWIANLGDTALSGLPADFSKLIAEDTEKWAKVIRFVGIKAD
jgi:hypothetical protein